MQEWLNWHAWKACVPQKGTEGSNPSLSAFQRQKEEKSLPRVRTDDAGGAHDS
jgi:hypothetical protein